MSTTDANVTLERTWALIDLGRFTEAASTARSMLASDPSSADAACLLAQAELMAGNDLAAFESAQSAGQARARQSLGSPAVGGWLRPL